MDQAAIDALRAKKIGDQLHWVNGRQKPGETGQGMDVFSPVNGERLCAIADGTAADVDAAVSAARSAFEKGAWSRTAPAERKKKLLKLADLIEAHAIELAVLGTRDNGTEISMSYKAEPLSAAATFRYYAEAIDKTYGEIAPTGPDVLALIHKEALGVIGIIVPWNFPLMIGAWKIAPALAAGNSVIIKPPEIASLTLLEIARLAAEAGIPEGVVNVVTGRGSVAGEALGLHRDIDCIAFTGSGATGRRLLEYAARSNLKRVYLELGGKSPNIVFADAPNLDLAAKVSAAAIFRNAGQVCVAGSRMLVQNSIYDAFMEKLHSSSGKLKLGDPLSLTTDIGAVSSEDQLARNLKFVQEAPADGASITLGGKRVMQETGGTYMEPTIIENVKPAMRVAREEVFGPVLAVMKFDTMEEAIRLANDTDYGLAAAVWTTNLSTAHKMVKSIRAGVVHVNTYGGADITVPLGGFKQSGFGRDKSLHALEKYYDLKTAWMAM